MNVTIGNYEVECDIDPTVQNNASDEKIQIKDIGFIYNRIFKKNSEPG